MGIDLVGVNSALVAQDSDKPFRWYDAFGAGVVKYIQDFATLASDDSTGDAIEWELTITEGAGNTTHVITDLAGGALLITTGTNENDGISMQLGAAAGENIILNGNYPLYVGATLAINDVDQTDLFLGVGVTDTDWSGGVADAMYFNSVDESAVLNFVTEKNSIASTTAVHTLVDATYVTMEFLYDGTSVYVYIDGVEIAKIDDGISTFPNDELMRLSLEFLTGEGTGNTCTLTELRMIHIR